MFPLRRKRHRHAFTLIEMTVVISILALMAAVIMPNLVAIKRSRELRELEWQVRRLPAEARVEARRRNARVTMRVEGDDLVLFQMPTADDTETDPIEIKRVPLNGNIRVDAVRRGTESIDTSSWEWIAYPDGSSDSANIAILEGDTSKSLVLPTEGEARWITEAQQQDPDNPGDDDEHWVAGEVEQRGAAGIPAASQVQ
jgi:prepilin-type N-terminal cleavage/methylation domain-containing protein